jgi:hypothetical protein
MATKHNNSKNYDEIEYAFFCDGLEKQYSQAKDDGMFEVLKVLELDKTHSDYNLVQAVDYFKENDGVIKKDAPIEFLTEYEKNIVNKGDSFRSELYCMLLSSKFAEALENKSAFMQHSFKYAFDSQ